MTKEEFEAAYLPDKTSQYTILKRDSTGALYTIPYHEFFNEEVLKAADLLEKAAELAEDPGFKKYLQLRAKAFRTDDYYESDMAWMDMLGVHHVWRYARKVQADPSASLVHDISAAQHAPVEMHPGMDGRHKLVALMTLAALGAMVYGIAFPKWYILELGAIFLALALFAGLAGGLGANGTAKRFAEGAAELASTALLIGFARSIALILEDGQVLHTIVNGLSAPLLLMGAELAAVGMLAIQLVINLFIPSGSGQAFVTMPLMAPIGDLVGVTRQTAVLAFQFGDGFANMIVPTNPVLMGILGIAGIPYDRWLRFVAPLLLKLFVAGSITLVIAVSINLA